MGKILRIETCIIETPIITDIKTTYGSWVNQPHVIVRLTSDDGVYGLGESSTLGFFTGETPEIVRAAIDGELAEAIRGFDPLDRGAVLLAMDRKLPKNSSSKAAVDMALHDLAGKILGIPACRVMGGKVRDKITCAMAIGIHAPDEMQKEAVSWVGRGFQTLKVKIGAGAGKDEDAVRLIREAAGAGVKIRVDANQGYTPAEAIRVARRLERYDIEYMEQPVPSWDVEGLAHIRRSIGIPVAADEGLYSTHDALRLIKAEAVDVFIIKIIKTGGLCEAQKIAQLADTADIRCVTVSPLETTLGTAAGVHWASTLTYSDHDHELVGPLLLEGDPFEGVVITRNTVQVPEKPGLGVSISRGDLFGSANS
ncbi:MAG TPA: dipeptide epimerase [Spirochaetia bacterium]|nr:dipeptide epimerase [Spirochaetia bacterium]